MRLGIWNSSDLSAVITSHLPKARCSPVRDSCVFAEAGGVSPNCSPFKILQFGIEE